MDKINNSHYDSFPPHASMQTSHFKVLIKKLYLLFLGSNLFFEDGILTPWESVLSVNFISLWMSLYWMGTFRSSYHDYN